MQVFIYTFKLWNMYFLLKYVLIFYSFLYLKSALNCFILHTQNMFINVFRCKNTSQFLIYMRCIL